MKPFLFLGTRAEDLAADGEVEAVLRFSGLAPTDVRRVRLERETLTEALGASAEELDLDAFSGIILGGGPFNVSDPEGAKSPEQRRAEAELRILAERVVEADVPFLGCCYGIGTLGRLLGGVVDRRYGEPIGALPVTLTDEGRADPLLGDLSPTFEAFLGHKEAVRELPRGAVLLASSATCPVQAFRLGTRVYAHHGYFEAGGADVLIDAARAATVTEPPRILRRFVELFARD